VSRRYQAGILGVGFNPLLAPNAPTIGTATSLAATTASVAFTAPANVGGSAITSYAVQSIPGNIGATGSSSPITVSGLTTGTAYTFSVAALNKFGPSPASALSNSVTPAVTGQQAYTTPGTYSWVAPAGVTSVSAVAVGGGSRGGGGLGWRNNISVTPGSSYTVVVGAGAIRSGCTTSAGSSTFSSACVVRGGASPGNCGGTYTGAGGGNGGFSASSYAAGAGGYSGNGGSTTTTCGRSLNGSGGAGGSGGACLICGYTIGHGGGGVGILGQGANGLFPSGGGSGGANGSVSSCFTAGNGGAYGGGGGSSIGTPGNGAGGAVRIIWPGTTRSFPSTNTGNL
jgi:hypothetical protein